MVNVQVNMLRDSAAAVPQYALPAGYRFRIWRPGDDATWTTVQRRAEPFLTIGDDLFEKQFGDRRAALPERMFFVETAAGDAIGTISAWWKPEWRDGREWGQIHWVAVVPEHQGKGLSKPMMTHAMNCLLARHARTMLGTSTGRVYAIKVYLDYGFVPAPDEFSNPEILQGWKELNAILNHPLLKTLPA
ncbi:MAG TPA: GNAT family N-acetyltransferase [Planctomycetota bacterium]|nr:GNAT family N-acetyltransferase [Planctomycetota bacterium]